MDSINPDYYKSNGLEAIDIIEAYSLGFNMGNALKYILRAGKKSSKEIDLKKAIWYLQREVKMNGDDELSNDDQMTIK
jgi:hypothetical protein